MAKDCELFTSGKRKENGGKVIATSLGKSPNFDEMFPFPDVFHLF